MTTSAVTARTAGRARGVAAGRAGLGGAMRSELTKIRSTRSTYWALLAVIVATVGFGALASFATAQHPQDLGPGFDATQRSLDGLYISQLIIAVLGALTITSEYSTGMIRTSLAAQPRRGTVLAAKGIVFTAVALVTSLVTTFAAFFLGQALMSGKHLGTTLGQPNVLRAVIGGALFLTACGLLSFGLGLILRHTAGAITAAIGLLFVLTVLIQFLPDSWQAHTDKWVPALSGAGIWQTVGPAPHGPLLSAWAGFAVLAGYAVVAIAGGAVVFFRHDA
jgi:ABC-type transport system involved in multi-copper enzyme maturation permease subunit